MSRYACPDCHSPVNPSRRGKDGRCQSCRNKLFQWALANGSKWAKRLTRRAA